jgi:mannose-1-phosphate guanylyltransferase
MNSNNYIAIMAGGIGSRFWPSSTINNPKQFIDILGVGKSLIRMTFERSAKVVPLENILIVTNKRYKRLVKQHIPELPERNILCEPSMNNTAPCVAYTTLRIQAENTSAVFAVLPSDHVVLKEREYINYLNQAFLFAENNDAIVTLGIMPTRPDTGYGYIKVGCECKGNVEDSGFDPSLGFCKVEQFEEKPNKETAQKYVDSGNYLWNAGMFVWSVESILKAYNDNAKSIIDILTSDISKYGTEEEQAYIDEVYPNTQKTSVDYAILEKANNVFTLPVDIGWSDLGTWSSLHSFLDKDENETVILGENTLLIDTKNSIIRSDSNKIVVIKGLDDYIVIDRPEALLIYPKKDEQEIKEVVERLKNY